MQYRLWIWICSASVISVLIQEGIFFIATCKALKRLLTFIEKRVYSYRYSNLPISPTYFCYGDWIQKGPGLLCCQWSLVNTHIPASLLALLTVLLVLSSGLINVHATEPRHAQFSSCNRPCQLGCQIAIWRSSLLL